MQHRECYTEPPPAVDMPLSTNLIWLQMVYRWSVCSISLRSSFLPMAYGPLLTMGPQLYYAEPSKGSMATGRATQSPHTSQVCQCQ